ncbi:Glycoside hydrolase (plasmid) [Rhizobium freirei PRF 81]|uniref:Glycoside hydrolase n=1 Tax=Rhizobium freirei PRF 81 TaxID=363754 RepID=N6UPY2_9HYPH|nr:GH25 family lysozyme [Rhizobium freirei]ENN83810.1 Glycoside hydrolase [Rhizobium freirei PRF 81]
MGRRSRLKLALLVVSAFTAIVPLHSLLAEESRTESSWTDLPDDQSEDASRATLFEKYEVPAYNPNAPETKNETLAIPTDFAFPRDAREDRLKGSKPRVDSIFGIDISHYTSPDLDMTLLKQKEVKFIYIKATQGVSSKDKLFKKFWADAGNLPASIAIPRGAYHFLSSASDASGKAQANAFVDYLNLHGGLKAGDLPPVVDLEWDVAKGNPDRWVGHSADEIVAKTLECLKQIEARTGRRPIIYTAKAWFSSNTVPLSRVGEFKDYPIWIADYNPKRKFDETPAVLPGSTTAIWQFTDRAKISGISTAGFDSSIFYGTNAKFRQTFGLN